jgi:transcription termination factor Rho
MDDPNHHQPPGFGGGGHRKRRRRGRRGRGGGDGGVAVARPQGQGGSPGAAFQRPVRLADAPVPAGEAVAEVTGVLQVAPEGHGFLRSAANDFNPEAGDPWIPREIVQSIGLETGVEVSALAVPNARPGAGPGVQRVLHLNGFAPEAYAKRTPFKSLVAEDPTERMRLEFEPAELSTRVVDLIAPIGKGQRCLIVAPPKAGKTVLLQKIARSITNNHPEVHLIVLLVDERPEEVTDMRRTVRGEVIASSSDELARNHVQVAEIALERAKRLVECGRDVVVLLDSITRLSRAYNTEQRGSGRVLSGGIDARTMEKPRRFFGAARKAVSGGSLTVIGTALVDTGSRMDEVIFQEFKGTGNTEIVMDRGLFERRIFPAIDISQTGTRKEEKLFTAEEYQKVTILRRALAPLRAAEAMQLLTGRIEKYPTNQEFLANLLS